MSQDMIKIQEYTDQERETQEWKHMREKRLLSYAGDKAKALLLFFTRQQGIHVGYTYKLLYNMTKFNDFP